MKHTRRIAALLLMIAMVAGTMTAQFRFGIRAGVNINSLHVKDFGGNFDPDNGAGFTGGIMTEFKVPIIGLGLDASLLYSRMKANFKNEVSISNSTGDVNITSGQYKDFLEIPINIKYKFQIPVVSHIIAPFLATGPSFAFRLGGDDSVFATKAFQCAWNVGLGVELINHLQLSGSYAFGMNNIAKSMGINTTDNVKVHNNYWTITAAWLF